MELENGIKLATVSVRRTNKHSFIHTWMSVNIINFLFPWFRLVVSCWLAAEAGVRHKVTAAKYY